MTTMYILETNLHKSFKREQCCLYTEKQTNLHLAFSEIEIKTKTQLHSLQLHCIS